MLSSGCSGMLRLAFPKYIQAEPLRRRLAPSWAHRDLNDGHRQRAQLYYTGISYGLFQFNRSRFIIASRTYQMTYQGCCTVGWSPGCKLAIYEAMGGLRGLGCERVPSMSSFVELPASTGRWRSMAAGGLEMAHLEGKSTTSLGQLVML